MDRAETKLDVQPSIDAAPAGNVSSSPQRGQQSQAPEDAFKHRLKPTGQISSLTRASHPPEGVDNHGPAGPSTANRNLAKRPVSSSPLKPVNKPAQPMKSDAGPLATPPDAGPPLKRPRAVASSTSKERPPREGVASPMKTPADLMERLKEYVELCGGTLDDGWSVDVCSAFSP